MSRYQSWQHAQRWQNPRATVNLGSSTVTRVVTDDPDAKFEPRPAGFTATIRPVEPILWEGDGA